MHNVETLNKFLKDELSATETYQQALDKLREDVNLGDAENLVPMVENHNEAVASIKALIQQSGGLPTDSSGAWGTWAKMVLGGAGLLGKEAVLKALQEGEKNGAESYEKALQDSELPADMRALIETKLQPAQQVHIQTLERLLALTSA